MPRKGKKEKEKKSSKETGEEIPEEDIIKLTPAPKQLTKWIDDGRKLTKYIFKRWTYGDQLDVLSEAMSVKGKTRDTNIRMFNTGMIEKTVKEPKMTRQQILDLDPITGSILYQYCEQVNYPNMDFRGILAKLLENT